MFLLTSLIRMTSWPNLLLTPLLNKLRSVLFVLVPFILRDSLPLLCDYTVKLLYVIRLRIFLKELLIGPHLVTIQQPTIILLAYPLLLGLLTSYISVVFPLRPLSIRPSSVPVVLTLFWRQTSPHFIQHFL